MQQNNYSKETFINRLKSYDYKELENERLGFEYHKEPVEISEPKKGVYIGETFYSTLAEAAKAINVRYWTFWSWINGRRNRKMKQEMNLKLIKYK